MDFRPEVCWLIVVLAAYLTESKGNDPFDYEQRFPEDKRYEEMGPFARVWRTYLEECGAFDMEMLEGWRDGLDVLLVFVSALFNSHCIFTHMCIGRSLLSRGHYIRRSNITEPPS